MPFCTQNNTLSTEWIEEKLICENQTAMQRTLNIINMFRDKFNLENAHLTPDEFSEILVWKGLAKSKQNFLNYYINNNEIEDITSIIFTCGLNNYQFEDIFNEENAQKILRIALNVLNSLTQIRHVAVPTASAALRLAFPQLFGTVDYIVPGLMHCQIDDNGNTNPFLENIQDRDVYEACLVLPNSNHITPKRARDLAINNYSGYIRELWNIKRNFDLIHQVADIEMAIWSYGICYLKKQNQKENLPLRFQTDANPPPGGLFSKNCPNI